MGLVAGSPLANQVADRGTHTIQDVITTVENAIARRYSSGPISAPMQAFQINAYITSESGRHSHGSNLPPYYKITYICKIGDFSE